MHHLIGAQEISRMLGVSRQRVTQLTGRGDFPKPAAILAAGKVWNTDEVVGWAKATGREIREEPEPA